MGFLGAPLKHRTRPEWIPLAKLDDLPEGAAKEVTYSLKVKDGYHYVERKYSVYLRRIEDQVICLDPACTHLGCRVDYQAEYDRFLCPCHGGVFDNRGKVVSGPPPRALDQHRLRIQDGQIWILREV
jgi:Rieske Fe-S protein